jgi:hypothetical protein
VQADANFEPLALGQLDEQLDDRLQVARVGQRTVVDGVEAQLCADLPNDGLGVLVVSGDRKQLADPPSLGVARVAAMTVFNALTTWEPGRRAAFCLPADVVWPTVKDMKSLARGFVASTTTLLTRTSRTSEAMSSSTAA